MDEKPSWYEQNKGDMPIIIIGGILIFCLALAFFVG
jgi:hypothetical protein